jgi:hypothetical protein
LRLRPPASSTEPRSCNTTVPRVARPAAAQTNIDRHGAGAHRRDSAGCAPNFETISYAPLSPAERSPAPPTSRRARLHIAASCRPRGGDVPDVDGVLPSKQDAAVLRRLSPSRATAAFSVEDLF